MPSTGHTTANTSSIGTTAGTAAFGFQKRARSWVSPKCIRFQSRAGYCSWQPFAPAASRALHGTRRCPHTPATPRALLLAGTVTSSTVLIQVLLLSLCRHYVDALVQYMTGVDKACARFTRSKVQQRLRQRPLPLADSLIQLAQLALEKESADPLARIRESIFAAVTRPGKGDKPAQDSPLPAVALSMMSEEGGFSGASHVMDRQAGLALMAHRCSTGLQDFPAGPHTSAAVFSSSTLPLGYGGSSTVSSRRTGKISAGMLAKSSGPASAVATAAVAGAVLSRGLACWHQRNQLTQALHMQKQFWTAGIQEGAASSFAPGTSLRTALANRSHRLWASLPRGSASLGGGQGPPSRSIVQRAFCVRGAQGSLQRCYASGAASSMSAHLGIRTGQNPCGGAALKRLLAQGVSACRGAVHPVQSFAHAVQGHSLACVQGIRLGLTLLKDPLSIQGYQFSY